MNRDWKDLKAGRPTTTAEETEAWGAAVADALPFDTVLALSGDLGAGKTTFVRGMARRWGIRQAVTSPTFNLFHVYRGETRNLVHLDAYRLERADALEDLMLPDFLDSPWCLAVEWPENLAGADREWLEGAWRLRLQIEPAHARHLLVLETPHTK